MINVCHFHLQLLLHLAKSLFEEQMSLERLVCTIIAEAKSLLTCERCTVYLLDLKLYDAVRHFFFLSIFFYFQILFEALLFVITTNFHFQDIVLNLLYTIRSMALYSNTSFNFPL